MDGNDAKEGPNAAPLKSYVANVKVIVSKGEDKSEHLHHGCLLASISPWFDAQLSDMLAEEKEIHEIVLEDITTEAWLAMMQFFLSPLEARYMYKDDVMLVVTGYHKYEFPQGLMICDQVLYEYMVTLEEQNMDKTLDIEFMVAALSAAHTCHLTKANQKGCTFLKKILLSSGRKGIRKTDFSPSNIGKLAPIMGSLAEEDPDILACALPAHSTYQCRAIEDITDNPSFPHIFCMAWQLDRSGHELRFKIHPKLNLLGAYCNGQAVESFILFYFPDDYIQYKPGFSSQGNVTIDGEVFEIRVRLQEGGWKIVAWKEIDHDRHNCFVLWDVKVGGRHESRPPREGWIPVHPLAIGSPEIVYLTNEGHRLPEIPGC